MSATPRSARLSSPGEVVAILVATAVAWIVLIVLLFVGFFAFLVPTLQFSGRGDIPSDFPVYPGAQLGTAIASTVNRCTTVDATWSTDDSAAKVVDFYATALPQAGYAISPPAPGSGGAEIPFVNESEGVNGSLFISDRGGQTVIELTMSRSPAGANVRCLSGTVGG